MPDSSKKRFLSISPPETSKKSANIGGIDRTSKKSKSDEEKAQVRQKLDKFRRKSNIQDKDEVGDSDETEGPMKNQC